LPGREQTLIDAVHIEAFLHAVLRGRRLDKRLTRIVRHIDQLSVYDAVARAVACEGVVTDFVKKSSDVRSGGKMPKATQRVATEARLQGGNARLTPADWKSGDRLWLIRSKGKSFKLHRRGGRRGDSRRCR
jgi:hypothetical protein